MAPGHDSNNLLGASGGTALAESLRFLTALESLALGCTPRRPPYPPSLPAHSPVLPGTHFLSPGSTLLFPPGVTSFSPLGSLCSRSGRDDADRRLAAVGTTCSSRTGRRPSPRACGTFRLCGTWTSCESRVRVLIPCLRPFGVATCLLLSWSKRIG